jgi:hypothetical protein
MKQLPKEREYETTEKAFPHMPYSRVLFHSSKWKIEQLLNSVFT